MRKEKLTQEEKRKRQNGYQARYRDRHKEKERERQKAYRQRPKVKEAHRIIMAERRKNNPEEALEISRKNYKINGHKHNEKKRWLLKNDLAFAAKVKERELRYKASGRRSEVNRLNPNTRARAKKYREEHPEKVRKHIVAYRKNYWNAHEQEQRNNIDDCYVIAVLKKQTGYTIKTEEIPKSLIEVKKQSLKLKRELKNINNDKFKAHL